MDTLAQPGPDAPADRASAWLAAHDRDVRWLRPSEMQAEITSLCRHLAAVLADAGQPVSEP